MNKKIVVILIFALLFGSQTAEAKFLGIFGPSKPDLVKYGMRDKDVARMQSYLIKWGYLGGRADGVFGKMTLAATKSFQRDAGLSPDGIIGPKTMKALENWKTVAKPKPKPQPIPTPSDSKWIPMNVQATAYTRYDEGCTDYTYRGTYLRKGLVAVDPNVIPLGTRLYIPGYGYGLADDIGGAIQGHRIDLAMDTLDEAFAYGRQDVTIYLIR